MNRGLFRKNLHESAILFGSCGIALFAFAWFRVWVISEIDSLRFKQIIELLPEDWQKMSPVDFQWLVSYTGRTALTLGEPLLVMIVSLWAIVRSSDVVSGELGRGTLEMTLAQPVSRFRVFLVHSVFTIAGTGALCGLVWLGMYFGVQFTTVKESAYPEFRVPLVGTTIPITWAEPVVKQLPLREVLSAGVFWPGLLNLLSLGIFLTGVTSWLSSIDRFRWRTLGIAVGFYFLSGLIKIAAMMSSSLSWLNGLTFFSLYEPELHIKQVEDDPSLFWHNQIAGTTDQWIHLGPYICDALLLSIGIATLALAGSIFERRDLPAAH